MRLEMNCQVSQWKSFTALVQVGFNLTQNLAIQKLRIYLKPHWRQEGKLSISRKQMLIFPKSRWHGLGPSSQTSPHPDK